MVQEYVLGNEMGSGLEENSHEILSVASHSIEHIMMPLLKFGIC